MLGTCGGFQLIVIEYARNVLGISDAEHAEYNPDAINLVINPLSCNIKGSPLRVEITDTESKAFHIYNTNYISESYYCNYGINPQFQSRINDAGLKISGTDTTGEVRIIELNDHPFFIATLFVPQVNSSAVAPNQLITVFLKAHRW
jgi:CTP synthase (UTP-ammonia lyase)